MRVGELLERSGCGRARFKALRQRGQLPFAPVDPDGWQEFDASAAPLLALMVAICDEGLSPGRAKALIERGNGDAERALTILRGA